MTSEAPSVTEVTPSLSAPTLPAARRRAAGSSRVRPVISQILLSLVALLFLVPIIWMVLSALKPSAEVFTVPPKLFGSEILFSNFAEAWNYLPFGRFILNTIWVAGVGTLITLVASVTAGYAFARLNFKFQGGLFILYLSTLIVPQEVIVIPMFLVMQQLGWVNSYKALILPWAFTAFGTFLLRQFFLTVPNELEEAARVDGCGPFGSFFRIMLPLARPALAGGLALALMECLNDLGAVQYLGVQTLSVAIYTTWLQRSSLGGAAQIALVAVAFVLVLMLAERAARGRGRFHHTTGRWRAIPFTDLEGWRGIAAAAFCALPVVLGFVAPFILLLLQALAHLSDALAAGFWRAVGNSLGVAAAAAVVTVALGLCLAYARRVAPGLGVRVAVGTAGLGYALPGTVLALGLMIPLAAFDNRLDAWLRSAFGISSGLLLSGTLAVIVLAYAIRFLAVSLSALEAGFERLSPNLDAAARTLGETALSALWRVHIPLLIPALGAAALLVFVDAMKELPATLLLRPFNFETLATQVYSWAGLELFEQATLGALTIVLIGLVPVLVLHQAVAGGRAGASPAEAHGT